ncbi:hypothetical protein AAHA92_22468 [Salvia divinorum]|uniref:C2 NT-type domain-containing protein n=1 Tax=Salvia divinorum TaxID=28513 RepID=A0ABD1GRR7_SALDI
MLKLQNRSSKQKEGFHFKISNFQALQVPKGWDRLFLSLLSAQTGKTIAKLGKALVKNGSCHWSETVSESIYISRYDSSKSYEDCLLKIVVSTGSTRSANTLGEAIINMAQHTTSRASAAAAVSQPLQKCSYGTILQVRIQRLNLPRSKFRDEGSKNSDSQEKVGDADHFGLGRKSDESSDTINKHTSEDLATSSRHPLQLDCEEASESATVVINSISSMEGSYERENSFGERSEEYRFHERQDRGSNGGDLLPEFYSIDDGGGGGGDSPSNQSPVYLRENFHNEASVSRWSMSNVGSSRNLLEAAEDTIEELRAEAKMWERNARKLMIDLDISRKELSNLSKKQAEYGVELSAAYAEQDSLRRQLEKVMEELQQLAKNEANREAPFSQSWSLKEELESEIKYQQDLNDDLCQQLKQSQESNIELVSILQELEETIEQQRIGIENLSSLKLNFVDLQNSLDKSSEEKRTLSLQLEQLWESEKNLKSEVQLLDEALHDKNDELEKERESNREVLSPVEGEYNCGMLAKEEENASLEGRLSDYIKDKELKGNAENDLNLISEIESLREKVRELEKDCTEPTDENLELLFKLKDSNKTNIRNCLSFGSVTSEHPTSCPSEESEVSDPRCQVSNLEEEIREVVQISGFESSQHFAEILEQTDKAFHLLMNPWYGRSENGRDYLHGLVISDKANTTTMAVEPISSLLQELNELLETRISESAEIIRNHETKINERNAIISEARKKMEDSSILEVEELGKMKAKSEENSANLMRELEQKKSEISYMEADRLSKGKETDFLLHRRQELESEVSKLQQKMSCLEQDLEVAVRERKISSECTENLQSDVTALRDAVSSHVSANSDLEINIKQLEIKNYKLENSLSGLQEENTELQACISDQEVQMHQLRDEKIVFLQEIENCKSSMTSLEDEIRQRKNEMDVQILGLKRKSEDIRKQLIGAQEECVYLREENKTLQTSAASSVAETMELQNLNSEMKKENQELHDKCLELVDQLSEMEKSLSDCTKKVESLQDHLALVQEDFLLRESHLKSELDALVKENSYQKEKLAEEESLQQLLLEKTMEFQSLQKEVECLSRQLSDAYEERERISIEVSDEASSLLAEKAELQSSLREAHREAESTKNKFDAALQESELKLEEFTDQLAACNQRLDRLTIDYDRNLKLLANYRKIEEKLKTDLNDIELKHTISDYECQQLTREMRSLKVQLQFMSELEDEVSVLKSKLKESKVDKGKLEVALHTISGNYEELKLEKISLTEKITFFEDAMYELEECKRSKSCLEEKLQQMEKDLSEKEIISIQNEDLKHEVTEMKRLNVQFQQKMYRLEVEKDECLKKVQALEDNLKVMEEKSDLHKEGAHNFYFNDQDHLAVSGDNTTKRLVGENETSERQEKNGSRDKYERTKSSLETELRDLRQRYLEMSLKYAEVEGQREDLVMKLRATRTGSRWFS